MSKEDFAGRLIKVKERRVKAFPINWSLPDFFLRRNDVRIGDRLVYYMNESGDLIITKQK